MPLFGSATAAPCLIGLGFGGALLRWPEGAVIPAEVVLAARGAAIARVAVLRFAAGTAPAVSLVDADGFPDRAARLLVPPPGLSGLATGTGQAEQWSVAGEDTPWVARDGDPMPGSVRWDLTAALGLDAATAGGGRYRLTLDLAQHRCTAGLEMEWLDADGRALGRAAAARAAGPAGGRHPAGYAPLSVEGEAPPGTARLRAILVQGPAIGAPDAFVFLRRPELVAGGGDLVLPPALAGAVGVDPAMLGIVPLGDALLTGGMPLAILAGDASIELAPVTPPAPPGHLILTSDGARLLVEGAAAGAPLVPSLVAADGVLIGRLPLVAEGVRAAGVLALPPALVGAGACRLTVIGAELGETLFAGTVDLLAGPTPSDALVREGGADGRPADAPFAAERYAALTATLARLGEAGAEAWLYAAVSRAHADLFRPFDLPPPPDLHRMPCADAPIVSVIVPAHDNWRLTHRCLLSVLLTAAGLAFELVLVDDGSTDATARAEELWSGLRVVRHERARGFVHAANAGAAAARGDHLLFLNNDAEPLGRFVEELLLPFRAFDRVGATGAKLVDPDGTLQDAGGVIRADGGAANRGRGGNAADPAYNHTRPADYLSGAALMVSRAAWEAVGGFSTDFAPAYYEDTDLAFRLRDAGYATLYAPKALALHREGSSHGTDPAAATGGKRFQRLHAARFADRWRHRFRDHRADPDRPAVARALVVDLGLPRPDRDAGSAAICQEMRMLQALGYKVVFAPADMRRLGRYADALERGGVEVACHPHASLAGLLADRGASFDLVYLHRWSTAAAAVPLVRRLAPAARVLVNCADLHFLRALRAARVAGDRQAFAAATADRAVELAALESADAVLTYSDAERAVLEALGGPALRAEVIPFVAADPPPAVPLGERFGLGFVGSFDHPPNPDAVRAFLSDVWPTLRDRFPELVFRVAGSNFDRFVPDRPDDRVEFLGHVPDAPAFLSTCRVAVAPLRVGAGVKGKLFDAFAAATPSVVSPVAAEGLSPGPAARVARMPAEWVAAVSDLLTDDDAWWAASRAAADQAAERGFAAALPRFAALLDALGLPRDDPARPAATRAPAPRLSYDRLLRI